MIRFYGLNVMAMPAWLIDVLQRALNPLRAEETIQMALAARIAQQKQQDFQTSIQRLERDATPLKDDADLPAAVVPANDAAREWFVANGIRVIEA